MDSSASKEGVTEEGIPFITADMVETLCGHEIPWIAKPWVAEGALTELAGKIKRAGKTTWMLDMVGCVVEGDEFMGEPTKKTPVVLLTEQPPRSLREALRRAGLLGCQDLWLLFRHEVAGKPWSTVVDAAVKCCLKVGAKLLIVDTLAPFAGFKLDQENSSGAAQAAVDPLSNAAAKHGIGVVFLRHEGKADRKVGDSGRGSTAFGGAVDIVLSLRQPDGQAHPNVREIHALSRFDETPGELAIQLTDDGFVAIGAVGNTSQTRARDLIVGLLKKAASKEWTAEEIIEALHGQVGKTTVRDVLGEMVREGLIEQIGAGVKNAPRRYHLPQIHSSETPHLRVVESNPGGAV